MGSGGACIALSLRNTLIQAYMKSIQHLSTSRLSPATRNCPCTKTVNFSTLTCRSGIAEVHLCLNPIPIFLIMKKTSCYLLLLLCFACNRTFSQKLMHSYGATISVVSGTDITLSQTNLCYFPRYNFVENENSSISVGLPVGIGIGITNSTYGSDAGVSFAYDLPLVVDYNIGCKSTSENESTFGGYFGVGFGYYKVTISQSEYSNFTGATYGPMARAGIRFGSSNENWKGHGIAIGMFYKNGLEAAKLKTIGFNVMVDL